MVAKVLVPEPVLSAAHVQAEPLYLITSWLPQPLSPRSAKRMVPLVISPVSMAVPKVASSVVPFSVRPVPVRSVRVSPLKMKLSPAWRVKPPLSVVRPLMVGVLDKLIVTVSVAVTTASMLVPSTKVKTSPLLRVWVVEPSVISKS